MNGSEDIIQNTQNCYQGFFTLKRHRIQYQKFDGSNSRVHEREVLCQSPAVAILIHDPKANTVLLTEQVRIGAVENNNNPRVLEVPAGLIEPGESIIDAAKREMFEETGYQSSQFKKIAEFYTSPGGTDEINTVLYTQCALDAQGIHGALSENEDIQTHIYQLDDAIKLVGELKFSATTAFALMWLKNNQSKAS